MKIADLTLALVITSNVIISCHSATTHLYKRTDVYPQKLNLSERKLVFNKGDLLEISHPNRPELFRRAKRYDPLRKWNIRPIQIQLDIVLDRYRHENQKLESIYIGVIGCGANGCQNFPNFIPKPSDDPNLAVFNKQRHFGKKLQQLLESLQSGLQKIGNTYGAMIKYENTTGFYNKMRVDLLKDLKRDIKLLNVEVESSLTLRNVEVTPMKEDIIYQIFPFPTNQTDLIIQEWYIIQRSKSFLSDWQKILADLEIQTKNWRRNERRRLKKIAKSKQKSRKKPKLKKKKPRQNLRNS